MLDLTKLEQLIAFEKYGTLAKVSEEFHLSSPTLSRSMQHIEECFGVPLFVRNANKIALNETGKKAVELSKIFLQQASNLIADVRDFDQGLQTITIFSCAPAPLWQLSPLVASVKPQMIPTCKIMDNQAILQAFQEEKCDIAILPFDQSLSDLPPLPFSREELAIAVPKGHELAKRSAVTFVEINGYNFLLKTNLGFWRQLCYDKMPQSKFLVQENDFAFQELVANSSLPHFTTNLVKTDKERVVIPLTDDEAGVTYHIYCRNPDLYQSLKQALNQDDYPLF
ncbi:LysR family transcriptional regulator [Streptococcus sp. ZY1909104]|uniref:LysR family transcriptional regulator n=1 Tax=Streptococcus sp. ZY1909104 TaxID=3233335 RepID=UPI00349F94A1